MLEDVDWTGGSPASVTGVEIIRSRLTGITFTGLELTDLRLLDVELVECELSGATLVGARWERVVLRRCRMSGLVAAELQATRRPPRRLQGGPGVAPRRGARPLRGGRHRPARRRPLRRARHALGVPAVRPHRGRRERLALRAGVAPRIDHRPPQGRESLQGLTIGSDQLVPLALPILAARGITVDDDAARSRRRRLTSGQPSLVSPSRAAHAATSVRDAIPSFDRMFDTCTAAVRGEM